VGDSSKEVRIGAAGAEASEEVGAAPGEDGGEAEGGGDELDGKRHFRFRQEPLPQGLKPVVSEQAYSGLKPSSTQKQKRCRIAFLGIV